MLHKMALFQNSQEITNVRLALGQSACDHREKPRDPATLNTAMSLASLANIYQALGRPADALPLAERGARHHKERPRTEHPIFANRLDDLARIYRGLGRPADALPLAERALAIAENAMEPDHR